MRVRIFVDFWNYQLSWNERVGKTVRCDWPQLPVCCLSETANILRRVGTSEQLSLEETRVYASYNPSRDEDTKLKRWLDTFLDRQPSFRVILAARTDRPARVYCRQCSAEQAICQQCGAPLVRSREKGVDTAIATDLLSLAWDDAYDLAVLISSDADMVPAVIHVQNRGRKVINAVWPGGGHELARTCWAAFDLAQLVQSMMRPQD